MGNIQNICEQLTLTRRPGVGDVLTVDATGNDAEFTAAPGGVGGTGTPGAVAVWTTPGTVGTQLGGTDTTFNVPVGQRGVFALNGTSLVTFGGAGMAPTVNGGVASGDAAHCWANVYGRNFLSDGDATISAPQFFVVRIMVHGASVLVIPEPTVPTTWTWPVADAAGALQSNGAGALIFAPLLAALPFPDSPPSVPSAYDDEFTDAAFNGKWTVDLTPVAAGTVLTHQANGGTMFVSQTPGGADCIFSMHEAVAGFPSGTPITVIAKVTCAGGNPSGFRAGFDVSDNAGYEAGNFRGLYLFVHNGGPTAEVRRVATNEIPLGVGTFVCYLAFQRNAANAIALRFSADGIGWENVEVDTFAFAITFLTVRLEGDGVGNRPTSVGIDWIRVNDARFLLPII